MRNRRKCIAARRGIESRATLAAKVAPFVA